MSRLDRQSFLGPKSDAILEQATIGLVGLGGGGSHVNQQLPHMGVGGYVLADPDHIEDTNTNRLVGGTLADVDVALPKVKIAERVIRGLQPNARVMSVEGPWTDAADFLKTCDVIIGGVDSFKEREQLERFARKHLIAYIDIGMDVHKIAAGRFLIAGQVVLSSPGAPCLRCCGVITDKRLEQEANRYGDAGSRPQVVWSNGVLASAAVGLATQILSPWFPNPAAFVYLDYDGNKGTLTRNIQMDLLAGRACPHHPADEAGDPLFDIRSHIKSVEKAQAETAVPAKTESWISAVWKRLFG